MSSKSTTNPTTVSTPNRPSSELNLDRQGLVNRRVEVFTDTQFTRPRPATYPTTGFTPSATVFTPTPGPTATPANPGVPGPLPTPTPSNVIGVGLKTDSVAEQHMRQAIRDLVSSVDPYARLDLESEDALLDVASEFLDSVTNFSARLARHRSSDSLDVKDLQLHLERHHQIRIPGFASDDLSKPPAFSNVPSKASASSKGKEKERPAPALRSKRLAAARAATANAGKS